MIEFFGFCAGGLWDVSLRFEDGEHIALLGGRGDGPDALARALAGGLRASDGTMTVMREGIGVTGRGLRRNCSRACSPPAFPAHLHLWDILMLTAFAFGQGKRMADFRCEQALRAFGLEKAASMLPEQLPPDWQRRAALAQALVPDAGIVVLDRAFEGLKDEESAALVRTVASLTPRSTVFWMSDLPEDADLLNGRSVVLRNGWVIFDGTCADARSRYSCADFPRAYERMRREEGV